MYNPRISVQAALAALLLCVIPRFAWAQQSQSGGGGHSAGLQVGEVWPSGKIGEGVDGTIAPGLFYEYSASQIFALQVNAIRSSHNDRLSIFSTSAGIRANLTFFDRLVPYATAGVGLYFVNRKTGSSPVIDVNTTNFGLNFGLGADLQLGDPIFMGLWLGLHNLFSAKTTTSAGVQDENSGRWSGLFIRVGMRF